MKYESCTLKTTQVIVSEPKCWQSSVVTLPFDLLTPKCICIFLLPSYIYVWNMKAVRWKLVQLSCQNQSVDKVQLWPWPLNFWPKNVSNMKVVSWKLLKLLCQNQTVDKVQLSPWPLTFWPQKCTGIFLPPSYIYVWNMKAVRWKLVKVSCQNQSVDKVQLWPWPLTFWPLKIKVSLSCHPTSMYETWKLYVEN